VEFTAIDADKVANFVRNFPEKWLLPNFRGITEEALNYMRPLIKGTPDIIMKDGLPEQTVPFYMRDCEIEKL
jgi:6-phosphofructokinase 1